MRDFTVVSGERAGKSGPAELVLGSLNNVRGSRAQGLDLIGPR